MTIMPKENKERDEIVWRQRVKEESEKRERGEFVHA